MSTLPPPQSLPPRVQGHRGSVYREPENTLLSFLAAKDGGAAAVEFDVFRLVDGGLVVYHGGGTDGRPGGVEELTDGKGMIQDYNLSMVFALNFVDRDFACPPSQINTMSPVLPVPRIPTLREALDLCVEEGLMVTIELKGEGTAEPVAKMLEVLDEELRAEGSGYDVFKMVRFFWQVSFLQVSSAGFPTFFLNQTLLSF